MFCVVIVMAVVSWVLLGFGSTVFAFIALIVVDYLVVLDFDLLDKRVGI